MDLNKFTNIVNFYVIEDVNVIKVFSDIKTLVFITFEYKNMLFYTCTEKIGANQTGSEFTQHYYVCPVSVVLK